MRSKRILLIGVVLLLRAGQGVAGGPSATTSTVPAHITLVGSRDGEPDASSAFTVVARDLFGDPKNGCSVVIDLSDCAELSLCADQLDAGATVNCAAKTTRKFTNVLGEVSFILLGSARGRGNAVTSPGLAKIYADGMLLRSVAVSAFDLDGSNGVGINDLSVWLSDFGAPGHPTFARSDFDGNGTLGINDLSVWLTAFGAQGSSQGCTTSCP